MVAYCIQNIWAYFLLLYFVAIVVFYKLHLFYDFCGKKNFHSIWKTTKKNWGNVSVFIYSILLNQWKMSTLKYSWQTLITGVQKKNDKKLFKKKKKYVQKTRDASNVRNYLLQCWPLCFVFEILLNFFCRRCMTACTPQN